MYAITYLLISSPQVEVIRYMEKVDKMLNKRYRDGTHITRKQFQKCFNLSDAMTFTIFFQFDPLGEGRALSLDVWGALILACNCRVEDKIRFLFELTDVNDDHYIGPIDVERLYRSVSRGFSRFKGLPVPENR